MDEKKYSCKEFGCNYSSDNLKAYQGHRSSHFRKNESYKRTKNPEKQRKRKEKEDLVKLLGGYKCTYCDFISSSNGTIGSHIPFCLLNPNLLENKKKRDEGFVTAVGRRTEEERKKIGRKLSETIKKKVIEGTWHLSYSTTKRYEYKGVSLQGTWELKYAQWLDFNGIVWRRPTETFPYFFEGKEHRYTPDFYLPEMNCYIEIKGCETAKDKAKQKYFPKELRLIVLKKEELESLGII
jgi:hypothetical protein